MISLPKRKSRAVLWAALVMLAAVLLLLFARPALSGPISVIAIPLERLGASVSAASPLYYLRTRASLIAENASLRSEVEDARLKLYAFDALQRENDALKAAVGRAEANHEELAAVLQKPPVSPYDTLLIDIGADKNLQEGDRVFASSFLIGTVSSVMAHTSLVSLLSAPGRSTDVEFGASNIQTPAAGAGGGTFELHAPRDLAVSSGEAIRLPGMSDSYIGIIVDTQSRQTDAFQTVRARLPVNLFELRFVEVRRL